MLTLTNRTSEALLYAPDGQRNEVFEVGAGDAVTVPGVLAGRADDAYLVEYRGEVRAWPMAVWELDEPGDGVDEED